MALGIAALAPATSLADDFSDDRAEDVVSVGGGKVVVGGSALKNGVERGFALARYRADGTLDSGFGSNGRVVTPIGDGALLALSLGNDGSLTGAGAAPSGIPLARYRPNGALDQSFGTGGTSVIGALGSTARAEAITTLRSGRSLIAGRCFACDPGAGLTDPFVARVNADGGLDTSFGDGGVRFIPAQPGNGGGFHAIRVDNSGRIVVTGGAEPLGGDEVMTARLTAGGQLDQSFGTGGVARTALDAPLPHSTNQATGYGLAFRPGGGLAVAAEYHWDAPSGEAAAALLGYTPQGELDPVFGTGGRVEIGSTDPEQAGDRRWLGVNLPQDLVSVPGYGLVVAGQTFRSSTLFDFAAALYSNQGQLQTELPDTNFGAAGAATRDTPYGIATPSNGRVVLVGGCTSGCDPSPEGHEDFALAAYSLADGIHDPAWCEDGHQQTDFLDLGTYPQNCSYTLPAPPPPPPYDGSPPTPGTPPATIDEPDNGGCAGFDDPALDPLDPPDWITKAADDTQGHLTEAALVALVNQRPHLRLFLQAYRFAGIVGGVTRIINWATGAKELASRWQDRPCRAAFIDDLADPDINPESAAILDDLTGLSNGQSSWDSLTWAQKTDELNLRVAECELKFGGNPTAACLTGGIVVGVGAPLIMDWWGL